MLTIFPSLLIFGIFAPLFLRIAVGVLFLSIGSRRFGADKVMLANELSSRLGSVAPAFVLVLGAIEIGIGLLLIAGFLTQIAALLGIVLVLKALWFKSSVPTFARYEKTTYALLLVILVSLLFLGAGAPAIDLPL